MTNKEQIQAVRDAGFKKYDKVLHSKCGRPELYGIQRVPAAEEAIKAAKPPVRPRKDNRKFKHSVSCRLPKTEYVLLQQAFAASNEKTMQDYARRVLIGHAKEVLGKKKAATDAGTSAAVDENNTNHNYNRRKRGSQVIETNAWALTRYSDYPEPPAEAVRDLPEYGDRDLWPDEKRCCNCDVIDYSYTFTKNLCDHCLCETKQNKDYRAWFVFANIGDFADFIKENPIESVSDMEKRFDEFIEDDLDLFAEFVEETLNQWGRA